MLKITHLTASLSAVTVTVLNFSGLALAGDRFMNVGRNDQGSAISLDLQTIQGNSFTIYSAFGDDGLVAFRLSANCAERKITMSQQTIYTISTGKTFKTDYPANRYAVPESGSGPDVAMGFVCKKVR